MVGRKVIAQIKFVKPIYNASLNSKRFNLVILVSRPHLESFSMEEKADS